MSRLIDADALKASLIESRDRCTEWIADCDETMKPRAEQALYTFNECIMRINSMPTVEERKKGKWILDDKTGRYRCSECLSVASRDDHGNEVLSDYCGVCGAEMEKA